MKRIGRPRAQLARRFAVERLRRRAFVCRGRARLHRRREPWAFVAGVRSPRQRVLVRRRRALARAVFRPSTAAPRRRRRYI